ncbi:hypothetical protein [Desulfotomaculum copahuensis]|uniref:Glutaredoxin n=1 Tax=Desulfotomaculum copahuensis TaxID=1838280 RepID=A0A1B7LI91_9FIRM|nr:hypothetical protein [Desulfotomaculum copahuensis]OAT86133.1 hypothetical protein A6M21_04265 [Desulfotomaculum copahuensis]
MKPLHLEVIYAGDHNLSCFYMAEVVEAVAPLFKNSLTWDRVYILKKDGARRFYELSVGLYGEEGVRKKQQYAPIPSIFADGRLLFDQIPPVEELTEAIAGILKTGGE